MNRARLLAFVLVLALCGCAAQRVTAAPGTLNPSAGSPCELPSSVDGEEGPTDYRYYLRPVGTVRALMVFVDFPDAVGEEDLAERFAHYRPVSRWFQQASYGKLDLQLTPVLKWARMPKESTDYGMERGFGIETQQAYIRDALEAVARAEPSVDFGAYSMVHIMATLAASEISAEATAAYTGGAPPVQVHGAEVAAAITYFGDDPDLKYRVVAHETAHLFGLPDLYPEKGSENGRYVGEFDVMGELSGRQPDFFAWHKRKLGWLGEPEVACVATPGTTRHHISPVEKPGGVKLAVVRSSPTRATVIEVRAREGVDVDACHTGVVLYSVDSTVRTGEGPIRLLGERPESCGDTPSREYHYKAGNVGISVGEKHDDGGYTVTITKS
ncbi:M6 family metalloprotease domain-containing protein [Nonomuraea sp. NPDC050328]|uniref:M6 family metalloprotease domain-containing protein n=1 Tax=Nonomuraea sp. NPDC050328 TaxID=3364361 RepID=UPI0037B6E972